MNNTQLNSNSKKKKIILYYFIIPIIVITIGVTLFIILNIKVFKIHGTSMYPTFNEKDFVLSYQKSEYNYGDIIAFHHNNAIMIKRIIALPKDKVTIDEQGLVYVNDKILEEPYIEEKSLGLSEIEYPYEVPENTYFVLGDNREDSLDSRIISIGAIKEEDIVGKIVISLIPFHEVYESNDY